MIHQFKRFICSGTNFYNKFEWIKPNGKLTNIVVYNPITKSKTPLILRNNNVATWYMCGPTVYDSSHIGHACTYVKFDIMRRILSEFFDINVVLVMGLTDIDDKIINRSILSGQSWQSLTQHYTNEFFSEMDSMHVLRPLITCKVSDYILDIISFIKKLINKNNAYVGKDGSVYFDTSKCKNYGKFNISPEESSHDNKKSSLDFALWKAAKENEPYWQSPWGCGRPGWHIECSAIASSIFGENVDIHSGGIDLIFPHHENEEAQSCAYYDTTQWVNYWLHTGHLHLQGDLKMSKSLQNTISIPTLLNTYTANQFRMLCLLTHYRKNLIFSNELLQKAVASLKTIEFFISDCNDYISGKVEGGNINELELLNCLEETRNNVIAELANDFNTPVALQAILRLISVGNKMLRKEKSITASRSLGSVSAVSNYVQSIIFKLGILNSQNYQESNKVSEVLDILVDFRNDIRTIALEKNVKDSKSLTACDTVRKNLSDCGIDLRDKNTKTTWTLRGK